MGCITSQAINYCIYNNTCMFKTLSESKTIDKEIRKVQALTGDQDFTFVLPKIFATRLGISKGDF